MEYIFCLFYFVYAWIIYRRCKDFLNPIFLFCMFWGIINLLVIVNLFSFYYPSKFVFILSFCGCTSFFVSYLIYNFYMTKKNFSLKQSRYRLRRKLLNLLFLITLVYMIYRLFLTINVIIDGKSLDYIRRLSLGYDNSLVKTKFEYLYNGYINKTLIEIIFPILGCVEFSKNKNWKYLALSFILMLLNTICTGGRFALYYFVIIIIYTLLINFSNLKAYIIKNKKVIFFVMIFAFVSLAFVTVLRSGTNIFSYLYAYFSGAFYNLSVRLESLPQNFHYTYGASSFLGIFKSLFVVLDNINVLAYPNWYNYAIGLTNVESFIFLSDTIKFNAYVTPIYSFYLDGGILGVVLGFFGSGLITSHVYRRFTIFKDSFSYMWLLFIVIGIFTSMVVFPLTRQNFAMSIFFFLILFKKEKIKD